MRFEVRPDPRLPEIRTEAMQYDGFRFRTECELAGAIYGRPFGVDVAFGDPLVGETEMIVGEDLLAFAGVGPPRLRLYPVPSHVAEKLHAFTMPRAHPNSREEPTMICDVCRGPTPNHRSVHVTGRGDLCFACFNDEMAARMGVDFDHAQLASVILEDAEGESHTFDIVSRLGATGHVMEALEVKEGEVRGYSFAVLGDFEVDAMALFSELYERMRQGLAARHVRRGDLGWQLTEGDRLSGRIEWDDARDGEVPCLVVDGKTFTWDQVGRMLMAYEGFVVEMNIRDHIEILDDRLLGDAGEQRAGGSPADG